MPIWSCCYYKITSKGFYWYLAETFQSMAQSLNPDLPKYKIVGENAISTLHQLIHVPSLASLISMSARTSKDIQIGSIFSCGKICCPHRGVVFLHGSSCYYVLVRFNSLSKKCTVASSAVRVNQDEPSIITIPFRPRIFG